MGHGLQTFLAHPAFHELPAILETPGPDRHGPDACELTGFCSGMPQALKEEAEAGPDAGRAFVQSVSCAKTRKLGLATDISENSGLRHPTSSPRCS